MYLDFSLDQLSAFLAVVDEGSFSAAGRRLGRVQSAVSYAIAQLEQAVGTELFDRSGRTPVLTPAGRRLSAEARLVMGQARAMAETAAALGAGVESELRVVMDAIYPTEVLVEATVAFREAFPHTALRMEQGLLGEVTAVVREGEAALGICNLAGQPETELHCQHLGAVRLLPVCAPEHPLAAVAAPQRPAELAQHIQVVHSERRRAHTDDQGVIAQRTWRVTELPLKVALILRGVGWGSVPEPLAAPHLASGRLVRLSPEPWPAGGHELSLHAVWRPERPLGLAGSWFRDRLHLRTLEGA